MKTKSLNFKSESAQSSQSGVLFAGENSENEPAKVEVGTSEIKERPEVLLKVQTPKKKKRRRILTILFLIFFSILLVAAGVGYFFVIAPVQRILSYADDMKSNATTMLQDFQSKDLSNVDTYFNNIQGDLTKIDGELSRYDFLGKLDATKGYYNNFQIARGILKKSSDLIQATLPQFKDVLKVTGFKTEKGETIPISVDVNGKEEGAVTLILKELPQYLTLYNTIEPSIIDILADVKKIDLNYVPDIGGYNLKEKIASTYDFIDQFPTLSAQTTSFLKYIPDLVGATTPAKYLLILQNETEMRSSGGLLTSFGYLTMDKGQFGQDIFLTDMWNWQNDLWAVGEPMPYDNIYGQNYLMNLGCGATELRVQDAGIYPDLHEIGRMLQNYYKVVQPAFPDKYPDYDYILFLDETFATNLINIIQPLDVAGYGTVTGENLYDFIKGETDQDLPADVRKEVIKVIANAAKEKFLNLPVTQFPQLLNTLIESFQRRDIAIESKTDDDLQKYLDSYGMSGRMAVDVPKNEDYFHFNEAQNCSLKLNKFIRDNVTQDVYIQDDGTIKKTVGVKWLQTQVFQPGLEKQYSPSTSFSYRAWVRFFTPVDSSNFESDGYQASGYVGYYPQVYYDDVMNKKVSDNIVQFDHRRFQESDPVERGDMTVSYVLPREINYTQAGSYVQLIQKHNGKSWGEPYTINIHDGSNVNSVTFTLDRDKVLTYKNGIITVDNYDKSLDWLETLVNSIPWDKVSTK